MAYEFKRLSNVDVIENINDNLNVLVENSGKVVKIPVNNLVPEDVVVQSEMDAAIAAIPAPITSWNDLTDKPFYESGGTITWGGRGSDSSLSGSGYYHVSDMTPKKDELIGAKYEWNSLLDGAISYTISNITENSAGNAYDSYYIAVALEDNVSLANGTVLDKAGIYFMYSDDGHSYTKSLKWGGLVTIDDKFIPNTVARVADLPVAAAVSNAAGETPTAAEFNALLTALRNAGLLAT